ncbi:hypothetical protein RSOLAG1IB_07844 [Rhizoctonia solani AG-1 IB]|uniref:Cutinase n=1 Tax=Thanatephorus cucumeris (strain AG1-IB / isolate 7/3/14) TaxID=1108050 RepID=A0A0B7FFU4_THACB|nr:hypothetical protein RSOLAG1IB_07844 [Rhizoctonia solani AG-1 IB]
MHQDLTCSLGLPDPSMIFKYLVAALLATASVRSIPIKFEARKDCSVIHLVHASGTWEEPNLGALGGPLAEALAHAIPGTTSYGVPYNTSAEYNKTLVEGAAITAQYLRNQAGRCPGQQFVLSGASKGAMLMHTVNLDDESKAKVLAVLVFGDGWRPNEVFNNSWPINSPSVDLDPRDGIRGAENVASFCNKGDTGCEIGSIDPDAIPPQHLSYPTDGSIDVAVEFVKLVLKQVCASCI